MTTDRALEQLLARISTLRTFYESAEQKQVNLIQLDYQMRDLLDIGDYIQVYGESDTYLLMIGSINWLLHDKKSKTSFVKIRYTTHHTSKGRPSWILPKSAHKVTFHMSLSPLSNSPVAFSKPLCKSRRFDDSRKNGGNCDVNPAFCVSPRPQSDCVSKQIDESGELLSGLVELASEEQLHSLVAPLVPKDGAMNARSNRRQKQKLRHKARM